MRYLRFTAVPEHGPGQIACASVVQEERVLMRCTSHFSAEFFQIGTRAFKLDCGAGCVSVGIEHAHHALSSAPLDAAGVEA